MWALLGATNAMAMSHNHGDHQHHQSSLASPFDDKKEVRSLHCLLKGHTGRVICPHSNADRDQATSIATDCGGRVPGAVPNTTSFSSDFAEPDFLSLSHSFPDEKLTPIYLLAYHRFADSLDTPPIIA